MRGPYPCRPETSAARSATATPSSRPLLRVRDLTLSIDGSNGESRLVQNVRFDLYAGETLALVGESGSGKTLTALALLGLLPQNIRMTAGEIWFREHRFASPEHHREHALRGRHIAMIFQDPISALNPVFRVGRQISDVVRTHLRLSPQEARNRATDLLAQVGFRDPGSIYAAYPHQLSGGMAQRVMIAMALSCDPEIVIADEPTSALDVDSQAQVLHLIGQLQRRRGFALLLITHDIGVVLDVTDFVAVMHRGKIIEYGESSELSAAPRHPYTRRYLSSVLALPCI